MRTLLVVIMAIQAAAAGGQTHDYCNVCPEGLSYCEASLSDKPNCEVYGWENDLPITTRRPQDFIPLVEPLEPGILADIVNGDYVTHAYVYEPITAICGVIENWPVTGWNPHFRFVPCGPQALGEPAYEPDGDSHELATNEEHP